MKIDRARVALEAKLIERGVDKAIAAKEAERFAQDHQGIEANYPIKWISWKANMVIVEKAAKKSK